MTAAITKNSRSAETMGQSFAFLALGVPGMPMKVPQRGQKPCSIWIWAPHL